MAAHTSLMNIVEIYQSYMVLSVCLYDEQGTI